MSPPLGGAVLARPAQRLDDGDPSEARRCRDGM